MRYALHNNSYDFSGAIEKLRLYRWTPLRSTRLEVWSSESREAAEWLRGTFSKPKFWTVVPLTAEQVEEETTRHHWRDVDEADARKEKKRQENRRTAAKHKKRF